MMAIILAQVFDSMSEKWDDMRLPRRLGTLSKAPKLVETAEELADQLVANRLTGRYRVVTDEGAIWIIDVIKFDEYKANLRSLEEVDPPS